MSIICDNLPPSLDVIRKWIDIGKEMVLHTLIAILHFDELVSFAHSLSIPV